MDDALSFSKSLARRKVFVFKHDVLREACIVQCHYDTDYGDSIPSEKVLVEYLDDGSKEMLKTDEYTFVLKFALQRLIDRTEKQLKHLNGRLRELEQRMEAEGGFKPCFKVGSVDPECFRRFNATPECFQCPVMHMCIDCTPLDPSTGLPYRGK